MPSGFAAKSKEKRKTADASPEASADSVHSPVVGSPTGMPQFAFGQRLDESTRVSMEDRFGRSFSDVRIHTDRAAATAARQLNASAFAQGQNIFFGEGRFQPGTTDGNRLLAHELTHTIQQRNGAQAVQTDRPATASLDDPLEREAQAIGAKVASGGAAGPISAAVPGSIQRNSPSGGQPGPGTAIVPSQLTLDNLIRVNPDGFVDPALDRAYQDYRLKPSNRAAPREWALHQTSGGPRARLELLLGRDYAVGERSGQSRPPVNVLNMTRPADYTDLRLQQDYQTLAGNLAQVVGMADLLRFPILGGLMNVGDYSQLQGIVGEALARPLLLQKLAEVRRTAPDAQLFLDPRARLLDSAGTPGNRVKFSDGLIGAIRNGHLIIFFVGEVKSGAGGGIEVTEQTFRWIEAHGTVGLIIELEGVPGTFEYSDNRRNVVFFTSASRLAIVPAGAQFPGEGSGHRISSVERLYLPANAEQIQYLTRLVARNIMQFQAAVATMHQALQNVLTPLKLTSLEQLRDPAVLHEILTEHDGLVLVRGQLFRLSTSGMGIQIHMIKPSPISPQLPSAAGGGSGQAPAAESGAGESPAMQSNAASALSGPPAVPMLPPGNSATAGSPPSAQGPALPPAAGEPLTVDPLPLLEGITGESASAGGLRIIGLKLRLTPNGFVPVLPSDAGDMWVVADEQSGKRIAGIFEGNAWYSVSAEGHFMPLDAEGNELENAEPLTMEQMMDFLDTFGDEEAPAAGGPAGGSRLAAAGLAAGGAIQAINDMLEKVNMVRDQETRNIALQYAAIEFWATYGADPKIGMWDRSDNSWTDAYGHAVSTDGTKADISAWTGETTPYIEDINIDAFRVNFPQSIHNYKEFLMFMDTARQIEAFREEPPMPNTPSREELAVPRRYFVVVNWMDPRNKKSYDITDIVDGVRGQALAALDAEMRHNLTKLSPDERKSILRLKQGSETKLYRNAGGGFFTRHGAIPVASAQVVLGPDPWVRPVGPNKNGKVLVTAANADAERSSLLSAYLIISDISDVLDEVQKSGRKIEERTPHEGDLVSFVAGPDPAAVRFGETRYYRQPGKPDWTVAIGELNQFWVDEDDLEPVDEQQIAARVIPQAR